MFLLLAILGVSFLILVHEFGHFIVSRLFGVKVEEFMLGMPGPKIFTFKVGETTYGVTILLFGGYVKFAGTEFDDELPLEERHRGFNALSFWKKMLAMGAGPIMNLILAMFLIISLYAFVGVPTATTTIDKVLKDKPAAKTGFKSGDKVVSVNNIPTGSWDDIVTSVQGKPNQKVTIVVERGDRKLVLKPKLTHKNSKGFLGIQPVSENRKAPIFKALYMGASDTIITTYKVAEFLFVVVPGKVSMFFKGAVGPVGAVYMTSEAARRGVFDFIWFLAIISIALAVFNVLPLPPLDGGRLVIIAVEGVIKRPISRSVKLGINAFGALLLITLLVYLVIADVQRFILPHLLKR